jgi:hypothetical protein
MITACELCAKIALENALKEEAERIEKMKVAKYFVEEVIAPIVENATEVPNKALIGYRYHAPSPLCKDGMAKMLSDWRESKTARGHLKKTRSLTNWVGDSVNYSLLDYEFVNQYLAEFGFQISYNTKSIVIVEYSSSTRDAEEDVDFIYLSMTCPLENY